MTLKEDVKVTKEKFLHQIANEYGFFTKTRDVFIARFAEENVSTLNKEIANKLEMEIYDLSKYLNTICSKFGFASNKRGRQPRGQSPWKKAYKWIWNEKYHDFIKREPFIDNKEAQVKILIDWRLVCSKMLEKQQETQQLRHQATSMGFEVNVHAPLGLVERKEELRWQEKQYIGTVKPVKEVITKIYKHDEFLLQVIGEKPLGKNKHAAIVGEPGAGKTTLLSKIASFINLQPEYLPIFISLASLRNLTLQDYLFKKWLPEAMGLAYPKITDTSAFKVELIKRFREHGVWLLLDAVDEIGGNSPVHVLAKIDRELKECFWLGEARVVLTCRLNVWDININRPLTGFDTYKTQEFKPEEIDKFILEWFTHAEKLQLGEKLQAQLKKIRYAKIYELAQNPLRLALLCQIFYRDDKGEFPETKAALYQKYIRSFSEWKPENYPVELIQSDDLKDELHQALGKLALAGIDSNHRFGLPRSICRKEMGEKFFKIACDIGWLVLVGRTDTDEDIFVFWHQNFQEYFAALFIDNWHYFFKHVPHNPDEGIYRVFEPQWKEVLLLWLGRDDIDKHEKEKFINELVNFNDSCNNSYEFQALFLAAAGISEFKNDDKQADEIVKLIIKFSFGTFNSKNNKYSTFIDSITIGARAALIETDRKRALKALQYTIPKIRDCFVRSEASSFLKEKLSPQSANTVNKTSLKNLTSISGAIKVSTSEEYKRLQAIEKLKKIDPSNPQVVKFLIDLVQNTQEFHIFSQATKALEEIYLVNSQAELFLLQLLKETNKDYIRLEAAKILAKITTKTNVRVTATILDLFINFDLTSILPCWEKNYKGCEEDLKPYYYRQFENILAKTAVADLEAITTLIELLPTGQNWCWRISSILEKIAFGKEEAVMKLKQLLQSCKDNTTSWLAAKSLLLIDSLNPDAIHALANLVAGAQDKNIRWLAAEELWRIGHGNTEVLNSLIEKVCDTNLEWDYRQYSWNIICTKYNGSNPDTVDAIINLMLDSNCNKDTRFLAMRELEEIGSSNLMVKDAFTRLVNTESDEDIRRQAVSTWMKINSDEHEAIEKAVDVLTTLLNSPNQNDCSRLQTAKCLEEVNPGNLTSTNKIIDLLLTSNDWEERSDDDSLPSSVMQTAANYLIHISDKQKIIAILKRLKLWITHPDSSQDANRRSLCWEIIFHYARNISYPEFFKAWNSNSSPIANLESQFTNIHLQLQATDKTFSILLNAHALQNETDMSAISQEICNQIYFTAFPNAEPPEVNNAAQVKRLIPRIKSQLQMQKLALILNNCQPNQELVAFCRKITDVVSIAWITDEPLEAPLRGFPPNQPNLSSAIQSWINEIE